MKTCTKCGEAKPNSHFGPNRERPDGLTSWCRQCRAASELERKAEMPAEEKAEAARAFRAGIRQDRCAVCGTSMKGRGVCVTCQECIEVLGGLEGLKAAVRAVRYLTAE